MRLYGFTVMRLWGYGVCLRSYGFGVLRLWGYVSYSFVFYKVRPYSGCKQTTKPYNRKTVNKPYNPITLKPYNRKLKTTDFRYCRYERMV